MALTKLSTDVIDLSDNAEALLIPSGTTASTLAVEYLVVAGGGGGASAYGGVGGGGGGAGGLLTNYGGTALKVALSSNITLTVGSGGRGGIYNNNNNPSSLNSGVSGNNSVFDGIIAKGGGGASAYAAGSGSTGGSGGGGAYPSGSNIATPGLGTLGQGNDGGVGSVNGSYGYSGGGGGGADIDGVSGDSNSGGGGGDGLQNNIDGLNNFYAAGGGAGRNTGSGGAATQATGGSSIGGDGAFGNWSGSPNNYDNGFPAVISTGSGGGGAIRSAGEPGGFGGHAAPGTVILRYSTADVSSVPTISAGLYGGYTTATTGQCHYPTTSNGISLFQLENNITDTCSNSTASWSGTPTYSTTSKFGTYSAEFDGGTGRYIDTGVDLDSYNDWTISLWLYRPAITSFDYILGTTDTGILNGFALGSYDQQDNSTPSSRGGKFDFIWRNASSTTDRFQGGSVTAASWTHIVITHTTTSSGTTTIYQDGTLLAPDSGYSNPFTGKNANSQNFIIGSAGTYSPERLNGMLDQVRVFNTVLTVEQVQALYSETTDVTTDTIGTETWSKFIAGTGNISFAGTGTGRPSSPTEGLMRENTTTGKMEFYDGSLWQEITDTASTYSSGLIPSANFNTVTYTGDGSSSRSIAGTGFAPDFTWTKKRGPSTANHLLQNTVNGAGTGSALYSAGNYVAGAYDIYGYISSFDADGVTYQAGTDASYPTDLANENGSTYVSWRWKAGGAAVTNNVGTIASQVSANVAGGFSIATWSGNGSASNIGHGLGGIPQLWIIKNGAGTNSWVVGMPDVLGLGYLQLESTVAASSTDIWGTIADSTKYYFNTAAGGNGYLSTGDYVGYFWRSIPGYSKIGFYVGNGSTQDIYMGFKPAWIMFKSTTSGTGNSYWTVFDNKRNPSNPRTCEIYPNSGDTEYCTTGSAPNYRGLNFTDTGIELLSTSYNNEASKTFIYMAFAE